MRRLGWVQRLAGTVKPGGSSGVGTSSTSLRLVVAWPFAFVFAWPFAACPFFFEWPLALLPFTAGSPKGIKSGFMVSILEVVFLLLNRVDLPIYDHGLADAARLAILRARALIRVFRQSAQDLVQLFVENSCHQLRRVADRFSRLVLDRDLVAVLHALRDHQPVDPVSCKVFHVAIQQARAFAVQDSVAIADHRPHRRARACLGAFSNARGLRPQIGIAIE